MSIYGQRSYTVSTSTALSLTCHVNEGLAVILQNQLQWVHTSLVDPANPVETVLTSQETLEDSAPPDIYGVDLNYVKDELNITLTINACEYPLSQHHPGGGIHRALYPRVN